MARAMPCPCCGPKTRVRRISRSSVPCNSTIRSLFSWVVIRPKYAPHWVGCQPKLRSRDNENGAHAGSVDLHLRDGPPAFRACFARGLAQRRGTSCHLRGSMRAVVTGGPSARGRSCSFLSPHAYGHAPGCEGDRKDPAAERPGAPLLLRPLRSFE